MYMYMRGQKYKKNNMCGLVMLAMVIVINFVIIFQRYRIRFGDLSVSSTRRGNISFESPYHRTRYRKAFGNCSDTQDKRHRYTIVYSYEIRFLFLPIIIINEVHHLQPKMKYQT